MNPLTKEERATLVHNAREGVGLTPDDTIRVLTQIGVAEGALIISVATQDKQAQTIDRLRTMRRGRPWDEFAQVLNMHTDRLAVIIGHLATEDEVSLSINERADMRRARNEEKPRWVPLQPLPEEMESTDTQEVAAMRPPEAG